MAAAYGAAVELPKPGLVALGGVAGAATRWAAFELTDQADWCLVAVNGLGAFLLGIIAHSLLRHHASWRLMVGVGFCGSLTTFSTLAVAVASDLDRGATMDGLMLLVVSIGAGLAAGLFGQASRGGST